MSMTRVHITITTMFMQLVFDKIKTIQMISENGGEFLRYEIVGSYGTLSVLGFTITQILRY